MRVRIAWLGVALALAPGCKAAEEDYEHGNAQCSDLVDNDGDRLVDCADPGCRGTSVCPSLGGDGGSSTDAQSGDPPVVPRQKDHFFTVNPQRAVDFLVVVDNSNTMAEEQSLLAKAWPQLVTSMALLPGGLPSLRIGVVSTDLGAADYGLPTCMTKGGDGGRLQSKPRIAECTPPSLPWIEYADGKTNVPSAGDAVAQITQGFSCIAQLGTGGCGFEHQLQAMRLALDPQKGVNRGFLRAEAPLVVLLVTDEDDCSAANTTLFDPSQHGLSDPLGPLNSFRCFEFGVTCDVNDRNKLGPRKNCVPSQEYLFKVQEYVSFLKGLKPGGQAALVAIAGPPEPVEVIKEGTMPGLAPSCGAKGTLVNASPSVRLWSVVSGLGQGSFLAPICTTDFVPIMARVGQLVRDKLGAACLQALKDTDSAPGPQVNCVVEDVRPGGGAAKLEACKALAGPCDPCPCWRVISRSECGSGTALEVARSTPVPPGTLVRARCEGL
ncbi:MAG: hypothetical protein IT371_29445, partial [Deltaproteobacteria bacterium]|nr:hypothetical protein [Deltaproteobacteria bacterium]